jgi:biotin carboxyl carrier protein
MTTTKMKRYRITLEDQTYAVAVLGDPRRSPVQVEVDGETFTVDVEDVESDLGETAPLPSTALAQPARAAGVAGGTSRTVAAPLPGVVKSIGVQPGQRVAAGDPLLVIEAMKMDNVIRAARAGAIGAVLVTAGRQVSYGETLLTYVD